jgi:hypothetical protein
MNPFVFVLGNPRSGTTLLARILDAHLQLAIIPEMPWIARLFKNRLGVTPEGFVTDEILTRIREEPKYYRFAKWGIGAEQLARLLATDRPVPYARFVSSLFDLYGRARGKALVGDKTPEFVRDIRVLHRLWPGTRFVHLVRDGRDVCLSANGWERKAARLRELFPTWAEDPVTTAALWWDRNVRKGRAAGRALGASSYYELRYESLVRDPGNEVERLCTFLGLPYDEGMLRFHEGRTRSEGGLSPKKAWLPITAGLRDWRSQMTAADLERFEAAAGDLLDELSYPRAASRPGAEALQRAALLRVRFAHNLELRNGDAGSES